VIALSCNELAHLFAALVICPVGDVPHPVALVVVETTTPGSHPDLPLPTASHPAAVNVTNCSA
jgi:hypothetical protein